MKNGRQRPADGGGFSELTFDAMTHYLYRYAGEGPLALIAHTRPDGDCIGSAFAMRALLEAIGCRSRVVCADRLPARLRFIARGAQDEIEAGTAKGDFAPGAGNRAVAIDVAAPSQLGSLEGQYDIVLVLDHHRCSLPVADRYLDSTAAATGEIVWRIARSWLRAGLIESIPREVSEAVYAAISSDTGCFRYSNVTAATHRIAAKLIGEIPDHAEIDRLLFEVRTEGRIRAEKAALDALRLYGGGRIAVCPMSRETVASLSIEYEDLDALIDVARSAGGAELAFSVREEGDGVYRVSARSNADADVAALCAGFGGGGHTRAAGCVIEAASLDAAVDILLSEAGKLLAGKGGERTVTGARE